MNRRTPRITRPSTSDEEEDDDDIAEAEDEVEV